MTRHDKINSLIPLALAHAKRRMEIERPKRRQCIGKAGAMFAWDYEVQFFHNEMDRLTKAEGLRV